MDTPQQAKTTAVKGTSTAREVRPMVKNIYKSAHEARDNGRKVARRGRFVHRLRHNSPGSGVPVPGNTAGSSTSRSIDT